MSNCIQSDYTKRASVIYFIQHPVVRNYGRQNPPTAGLRPVRKRALIAPGSIVPVPCN